MTITYRNDTVPDLHDVCALFAGSGIIRPVDNPMRIQQMLDRADLIWTAWDGVRLIGIARSLTDFCYCCYLSDLAVAKSYQRQGVGKQLVRHTCEQLGDTVMILLLAAETAKGYYEHIGFTTVENGWIIKRRI